MIQQAFILHLQNWIGLIQQLSHVLQAYLIEEESFEASEVNICMVEVGDEVACTLFIIFNFIIIVWAKGWKSLVKLTSFLEI